ncbi:MAG: hypothetical protein AAF519_08825 [Bacteroidota bacterium]
MPTLLYHLLVLGILSVLISSCSDDDPEVSPAEGFIRFTLIDPEGDSLVIRNFGTTELDISGYQLCLGPNQYNAVGNYTDIVGDLSLSADETVTIKLGSGTQNVTSLPVENGGLGLFASADDFSSTDPELFLDYVQWGAAGQNRVSLAVTAGRWDDAASFISGFSPYTFSGSPGQIGVSFWQTLSPEQVRLKSGFIVRAETPNGNIIAKYFSEMPSGTADLSDGQVFQNFEPQAILDGFLYSDGATDGTQVLARTRVNGNGQIVSAGTLPVAGDISRPSIADASTGVFTTTASSPAQLGVFDPLNMQLEGLISLSEEEISEPHELRNALIRDDEVYANPIPTGDEDFNSVYLHVANHQTGAYVSTAEFPDFGRNTWIKMPFSNNVDENGNIYYMATGTFPTNTSASLLKIPSGSNDFDLDYKFEPASVVNPLNLLVPYTAYFNYVANDIAVALAVTDVPDAALDIITQAGGIGNLTQAQLLQILGLFTTEEVGRWVKINVVTQDVEIIQGLPALGGFGPEGAVVIDGKVYLTASTGSENAVYTFNPSTDAVEKVFEVEGGAVRGLIDLSW